MKSGKYIFICTTIIVLLCSIVVFAKGDAYNTTDDPLISLSYVNEVLKPQLKNEILAEIKKGQALNTKDSLAYEVVKMKKDDTLLAKGSCEMILRSGKAIVISQIKDNGLSDLTDGTELINGKNLTKNHYNIVPRGDGRGIKVTSSEAYFMVRGEYEIVSK